MIAEILDNPVEYLKKKYKNNDEKILRYDSDIFSEICKWEQKKAIRNDNNIFLVHYKILVNNSPEKIKKAEKILQEIFYNYLRNSDVITKFEEGSYIQLLVSCNYMGLKSVIKRIKTKFEKNDFEEDITLLCDYERINKKKLS